MRAGRGRCRDRQEQVADAIGSFQQHRRLAVRVGEHLMQQLRQGRQEARRCEQEEHLRPVDERCRGAVDHIAAAQRRGRHRSTAVEAEAVAVAARQFLVLQDHEQIPKTKPSIP